MISKRTIFSLLVTLLGIGVIFAWSEGRRDQCSAYFAGDPRAPQVAVVATGTHVMAVPCDQWFLRQPTGIQVACLAVAASAGVFVVSGWADRNRRSGNG